MTTAGIIAEYNPFHCGHHYHIEETRRLCGADYVIIVMSGDFTQRGTPAITDKYERTHMALLGGADLVLELPTLFATGSAGDFAAGAISLLDKLGTVDYVSFGSETGSLSGLTEAAVLLSQEPPQFGALLKEQLKAGNSYARARFHVLNSLLTDPIPEGPNNLLGLEYMTALQKRCSHIRPFTIPRKGAGYHDASLTDEFPSAMSVRNLLAFASPDKTKPQNHMFCSSLLSGKVPAKMLPLWEDLLSQNRILFPSDLTLALRYRLLTEQSFSLNSRTDFSRYADVTRELSDKLNKYRLEFANWDDLCALAKSRELTYSRISRALCHILLGITSDMLISARMADYVPYARILGFKKQARPLLSMIKKNSSLPLLSKLADAHRLLEPSALSLLQLDITAAHLYESALASKTGLPLKNEYRQPIVIL